MGKNAPSGCTTIGNGGRVRLKVPPSVYALKKPVKRRFYRLFYAPKRRRGFKPRRRWAIVKNPQTFTKVGISKKNDA
jgi:hypothetical protein